MIDKLKKKKKVEKPFNSSDYLVKPHRKKSRDVTQKDVKQLLKDAKLMLKICRLPVGVLEGGHALAHPQINDKDPLRFFVLRDGAIMINPVILKHTKHEMIKSEGCLSYANTKENADVKRFYKVVVEFQTLTTKKKLSEKRTVNLKGLAAQIVQHEIDHMEAIYVFDNQ